MLWSFLKLSSEGNTDNRMSHLYLSEEWARSKTRKARKARNFFSEFSILGIRSKSKSGKRKSRKQNSEVSELSTWPWRMFIILKKIHMTMKSLLHHFSTISSIKQRVVMRAMRKKLNLFRLQLLIYYILE